MGIKTLPAIAPGDLERLMSYNWPGNVRELENLVERELIVHRDDILTFASLQTIVQPTGDHFSNFDISGINSNIWPIDDVVAAHINRALRATNGKISGPGGAAELLCINPNTLIARMKKLKIRYQRHDHQQ
jgi:DNA-binding NtrC family response regulator